MKFWGWVLLGHKFFSVTSFFGCHGNCVRDVIKPKISNFNVFRCNSVFLTIQFMKMAIFLPAKRRKFIVFSHRDNGDSYLFIKRALSRECQDRSPPCRRTVRIVQKRYFRLYDVTDAVSMATKNDVTEKNL